MSADESLDTIELQHAEIMRERLRAERRQLGGLMLLLGTCATIQPLASVSTLVGAENTLASTAMEIASLSAGLAQILFGSTSVFVGYLSMVHDYGDQWLSGCLITLTQLAWLPFVVGTSTKFHRKWTKL